MEPRPMLTVRFVKRLLIILISTLLLCMIFPGFSRILGYVFIPALMISVVVLKTTFPKTQVTADNEQILFRREFPSWYPLKKYFLHELIIPHTEWNNWTRILVTDNEGDKHNYYLFFMDERLCFAAEAPQDRKLEYFVQSKFPDRPLFFKQSFRKYQDRYDNLKDKKRKHVF
jgi:hypothetical protein